MMHPESTAKKLFCISSFLALALLAGGCRVAQVDPGGDVNLPGGGRGRRPQEYEYVVYYVREGDTLYQIGARFGVPWRQIQEHNRMEDIALEVGDILWIPASGGATEAGDARVSPSELDRSAAERRPAGRLVGDSDTGGRWVWPLEGHIEREYGDLLDGLPDPGVAISAPAGARVRAVADGTVICVVRRPGRTVQGWGNVVAIRHSHGIVSWYALLDSVKVTETSRVRRGEIIGTAGRADASGRSLIAFRLFRNERPVNPSRHLP